MARIGKAHRLSERARLIIVRPSRLSGFPEGGVQKLSEAVFCIRKTIIFYTPFGELEC